MEEESRRDKEDDRRKLIICRIILIIVVGMTLLSEFLCIRNVTLNNDYKSMLNKKREEANALDEERSSLEENKTFLSDISSEITTLREEYYSALKVFEDKVSSGNSKYKIAYLTFDDGPYNRTYEFLRILEENDVLATFFTIGRGKEVCYDDNSKSCSNVYIDIAQKGHTMANHTYSHDIFGGLYSSADSFIESLVRQEELIKEKTGIQTNIVRFPGGSGSAKTLKNSIVYRLRERGYGYIDWTAEDGDGKDIQDRAEARRIFQSTINDKIEVVLFHDYNVATLDLLPEFITYLKDNGYVLLPLFWESRMVNK